MEDDEKVLIGSADFFEAKRLRSELEQIGIEIELMSHPEKCGTGCKPTLEMYAKASDLQAIQSFLDTERQKTLEGLDVPMNLDSIVFDPEKASATCPACTTEFSTKLAECPECGLSFGGPSEI